MKDSIFGWVAVAVGAGCLAGASTAAAATPEVGVVVDGGFESGNLRAWSDWSTRGAAVGDGAYAGERAVVLGPERGRCAQTVPVAPGSRYRLTAQVRVESGAEEVHVEVSRHGGAPVVVSSSRTEYAAVALEFETARTVSSALVTLQHPNGPGRAWVDDVALEFLGEAPPPEVATFRTPTPRPILEEGGVAQQPAEALDWYLDARFGMFIHWGVYAAMDEGAEWVMHQEAMTPEEYRRRAEDPETGFTAAAFDPADWAALARAAGMKYMVLTARHHDGYALFGSGHPNAWTSVGHLGRDLIREYVDAVRAAGLHVGLYYSPMSWRYPGYYDVTGERAKPNVWGYETAAWHRENARVMKEEVYEQVTRLLSGYGPIEYLFWDGGWLGQSVDPALEDRFWDTGRFQDPDNPWPVGEPFRVRDEEAGRDLGIMGLVRRFQPDLVVNDRFGWVGDVTGDEGVAPSAGPIRTDRVVEKCLSLQKGGWGYRPDRPVFTADEVAVYLSDCAVRDRNLLLNVAPDRTGRIPENQRAVLLEVGRRLERVGAAIHGTRGGPWEPLHGVHGYTWRGDTVWAHVFAGSRERPAGTFTTGSLGGRGVVEVRDQATGRALPWTANADGTITIRDVDYAADPAVTILALRLDGPVYDEASR